MSDFTTEWDGLNDTVQLKLDEAVKTRDTVMLLALQLQILLAIYRVVVSDYAVKARQ